MSYRAERRAMPYAAMIRGSVTSASPPFCRPGSWRAPGEDASAQRSHRSRRNAGRRASAESVAERERRLPAERSA